MEASGDSDHGKSSASDKRKRDAESDDNDSGDDVRALHNTHHFGNSFFPYVVPV